MPRKSRIMEELERLHKLAPNLGLNIIHTAWLHKPTLHFKEIYRVYDGEAFFDASTMKEAIEKFKESRGLNGKSSSNK